MDKAQKVAPAYRAASGQTMRSPSSGVGHCFIDFEASSLDLICSYPIEVGICLPNGVTHSWLLKPAPLWRDWSAEAERVHGIPVERLQQDGHSVIDVAETLNELVPGKAVCDALTYDSFWLYRLFKAAKIRPGFELESLAAVLSARQINNWAVTRRRVIMESGLLTHRAGNDARILHNTWQRVISR